MSSLPPPSGPPPTGGQDKRSVSAHPRPKPPPIITNRSVSVEPKPVQAQKALPEPPKSRPPPRPQLASRSEGDVSEPEKIKESRSSSPALEIKKSSKSSSPSANRKSKAGLISLKSPTSGEILVISTNDLRQDSRPLSAETTYDDTDPFASNTNFATLFDQSTGPNSNKIRPENGARFVDYDGKFIRQEDHDRVVPQKRTEGYDWEFELLYLARSLQVNRHTSLHIANGLYAGLCLLTLVLLPSVTSFPAVTASYSDLSYIFVSYYSSKAQIFSFVVNVLVTLSVLSGMDIVLGERRTVPHRPFTRAFTAKCGIILCCFMALITNCVILGLDDNLFISGTDSGYGGRYGMPGWFTSQDKLIAASKDLELWRILNAIRGFAGCFNWILCSLCIDKTRTWSIVDSKNNQPRFMSKDQLAIV